MEKIHASNTIFVEVFRQDRGENKNLYYVMIKNKLTFNFAVIYLSDIKPFAFEF